MKCRFRRYARNEPLTEPREYFSDRTHKIRKIQLVRYYFYYLLHVFFFQFVSVSVHHTNAIRIRYSDLVCRTDGFYFRLVRCIGLCVCAIVIVCEANMSQQNVNGSNLVRIVDGFGCGCVRFNCITCVCVRLPVHVLAHFIESFLLLRLKN